MPPLIRRYFVTVHVHLLLGRFMLMIIMSVTTWMFPRPSRVRMPTVSAPARG